VLGLGVALIFPPIKKLLLEVWPLEFRVRVAMDLAASWAATFLILGLVVAWERRPLASIGFRSAGWRGLLLGVAGFLLGALLFIATAPLVLALGLEGTTPGIMRLAQLSLAERAMVVVTAGVTEEVLFRGYPIERLAGLLGGVGRAATIAYLVFVALHLPFWGPGGTIQIGAWSVVVTWLYVKTRSLLPGMLMHLLNDAYAFLLLPLLVAA
jgi:membrane protease YdiL (CAAX protease family)